MQAVLALILNSTPQVVKAAVTIQVQPAVILILLPELMAATTMIIHTTILILVIFVLRPVPILASQLTNGSLVGMVN